MRVRARREPSFVTVEFGADVDAAADEVLARHIDVRDDELQALSGARLDGREALSEGNRAL